jgi:hypothetical protein
LVGVMMRGEGNESKLERDGDGRVTNRSHARVRF